MAISTGPSLVMMVSSGAEMENRRPWQLSQARPFHPAPTSPHLAPPS